MKNSWLVLPVTSNDEIRLQSLCPSLNLLQLELIRSFQSVFLGVTKTASSCKTEASKISVLLTLLPSKPLLVVRLRSTLMDNLTQKTSWANNFKVWWGMSAHKRLEFIVY